MGLDTERLRSELREHAFGSDDEAEMSNAEADRLLNRAYWEVADKFPFREKEAAGTFVTEPDQYSYDIASITDFEAIRKIRILDRSNRWTILGRKNIDWYREQSNYYTGTLPEYYIRDGNALVLFGTPNDVYTVELFYWKKLTDISDSVDLDLPQSWHEIILYGALWRFNVKQKDWEAVNKLRQIYTGLITTSVPTEAKEERDSTFASVIPIRNNWRRGRY